MHFLCLSQLQAQYWLRHKLGYSLHMEDLIPEYDIPVLRVTHILWKKIYRHQPILIWI